MLLLLLISVMWTRPVDPKTVDDPLNRELTNEWRGWMQAAFVLYHYCMMTDLYAFIRVLVSSYVFLTGFGNGMYFINTW